MSDTIKSSVESPGDDDKLIASINESAKHTTAVNLTFLVTLVYLGISAAATTDEMLFLGSNVNLPIFSVGLPVRWFFSVAPALIFVLHLNMLIQEYLLVKKMVRRTWVSDHSFFPAISVNRILSPLHQVFIRVPLIAISGAVLAILPLSVLTLFFIRFLPYHNNKITAFHALCLVLDVAMVWVFFFFIYLVKRGPGAGRPRDRWGLLLKIGSAAILLFLTIEIVLLLRGYWCRKPESCVVGRERFIFLPYHRNISLSERTFFSQEPSPGMLGLFQHSDQTVDELIRRKTRGIRPDINDLSCADFSGSKLVNADFRGLNLRGAIFRGADLRGANFSPEGTLGRPLEEADLPVPDFGKEENRTNLSQASFQGADIRHARLVSSIAVGVNFSGALLQEADFRSANLERSEFVDAKLEAANLSGSSLRGANFLRASLPLANLSDTLLEFSQFNQADMEFVEFKEAKSDGADLREADLRGASGLVLIRSDLRRAKLGGADFCDTSQAFPYLSDLRGVDFTPAKTKTFRRKFMESLQIVPLLTTMKRLEERLKQGNRKTCLAALSSGPPSARKFKYEQLKRRYLLYDKSALAHSGMRDWPPSALEPSEFYESLALDLRRKVCQDDSDSASLLIYRLTNPSSPPNKDWVEALRSQPKPNDLSCDALKDIGPTVAWE